MKRLTWFLIPALFLAVIPPVAAAEVPGVVNFQGKLTDSAGDLVADGLYKLVFKLYEDNSDLVWTETFDGGYRVQVVNGLFNVLLGTGDHTGDLENIFSQNDNLFLGITVADGAEMAPRQRLAAAGYAIRAGFSDGDNPVGAVLMFGGTAAPEGWLLCDGAAVSRAGYPDLFSVIGTVFGEGDGSTTFNLPDLRDRFSIGGSETRALGTTGGAETIDLAHSHTVNSHTHTIANAGLNHLHSFSGTVGGGAHSHVIGVNLYSCIGDCGDGVRSGGSTAGVGSEDHGHRLDYTLTGGDHSHSYSGNTGYSDLSHNHGGATEGGTPGTNSQLSAAQSILPPYQVVNYIIKH